MPLPAFTSKGDLPAGIHRASLPEVLARFGVGTARRRVVAQRLERIHRIADRTGHLARCVVFGSFVTDKSDPNDVDIVLVMDNDFDVNQMTGEERLLFDHAAADAHFGASVFWVRTLAMLGGESSFLDHWQIKRDGDRRGIVEIVETP